MKRSIVWCVVALLSTPTLVVGQAEDDERLVRAAVEDYFAAITDYDVAALERAFHPNAVIQSSFENGRTYYAPFSRWRGFIERGRPADADRYQNTIVSVDISGLAASVKTDLVWPRVRYLDYLSLLKIDGEWKIVGKIWHQERR